MNYDDFIFKISKYGFAWRQLTEVLNRKIKLAYYRYIQSILNFGIIAWGRAYSTLLVQPPFVTQKLNLKFELKHLAIPHKISCQGHFSFNSSQSIHYNARF